MSGRRGKGNLDPVGIGPLADGGISYSSNVMWHKNISSEKWTSRSSNSGPVLEPYRNQTSWSQQSEAQQWKALQTENKWRQATTRYSSTKKKRSGKAIRPLVVLRPPLPVCTRTFDMISIVQFPCRLSSRFARNSDVYRLSKNKDGENENVEGVSTGNSHTHTRIHLYSSADNGRPLISSVSAPFFPLCLWSMSASIYTPKIWITYARVTVRLGINR